MEEIQEEIQEESQEEKVYILEEGEAEYKVPYATEISQKEESDVEKSLKILLGEEK